MIGEPAIKVAVLALLLAVPASSGLGAAEMPVVGVAEDYELSAPAGGLAAATGGEPGLTRPRINPLAGEPDHGQRGTWTRIKPPLDPLAPHSQNPAAPTPGLDLRFNGIANPFACGFCSPPDTVGDVGPQHFIQLVNATKVGIFRKADGSLARPPFDLSSLWSRGPCTISRGDAVVLRDEIANRWLLAQLGDQLGDPQHLCFAISQTGDPLGSFHLFTFNMHTLPDYFKVGVWPSGYYVSTNEATYTAYAFDRAKMLAGDRTASFVKFKGETNFLLPADVDGRSEPGGGGYFYTFKDNVFHGGVDRIELFRLTPDFATPSDSTFRLVEAFPIARFTYTVCGFFSFDCIPQKNTQQRVDAVSEWPIHRFAYRRIGDEESLVGNFTVGGGTGSAGAAIRWFELRRAGRNHGQGWTLYQEGTQDPGDGLDRFMGSIATDGQGNIALGYSASGRSDFPSIRYATRKRGDPRDTLRPERVLKAGGGSQTGSDRWGDYSAMTVDPASGCQFWYTNEYYRTSSATDWKTAVGAFTIPSCGF